MLTEQQQGLVKKRLSYDGIPNTHGYSQGSLYPSTASRMINLEYYIEVSPEAHQGSRVLEKSSPQPRPKPRCLVHTLRTFSGNVMHVSRPIEPFK